MIIKNTKIKRTQIFLKQYFSKNDLRFIIPFDKKKQEFHCWDDDRWIDFNNPISNYYYCTHDLSINATINIDLSLWGFEFFYGMQKLFNHHIIGKRGGKNVTVYDLSKSLKLELLYPQSLQQLPLIKNENTQLFVNGNFINSEEIFLNYLTEYIKINNCIEGDNQILKLNFKLKLNINQYLVLTAKMLTPGFTIFCDPDLD